jgi:hypothetical protein
LIRLTLHHWPRKMLHQRHLLAFLASPTGANPLHKLLATNLASIETITCPLTKALLVLISVRIKLSIMILLTKPGHRACSESPFAQSVATCLGTPSTECFADT